MQSSDPSLADLLSRSWGNDPTAVIDATCRAIVEELGQDSGPLALPPTLCAVTRGVQRTIVIECARRIDLD